MCAHNPTGVDPTPTEWKQILDVVQVPRAQMQRMAPLATVSNTRPQAKNFVTLFDCAYQGFATGDLVNDVAPVRMAERMGMEFFVAQSFSKNLGLYGDYFSPS